MGEEDVEKKTQDVFQGWRREECKICNRKKMKLFYNWDTKEKYLFCPNCSSRYDI